MSRCDCRACDNYTTPNGAHCPDCTAAGCGWSDDCQNVNRCRRCGAEADQATLDGEQICRDCKQHRQAERTTRDIEQGSLGDFA